MKLKQVLVEEEILADANTICGSRETILMYIDGETWLVESSPRDNSCQKRFDLSIIGLASWVGTVVNLCVVVSTVLWCKRKLQLIFHHHMTFSPLANHWTV